MNFMKGLLIITSERHFVLQAFQYLDIDVNMKIVGKLMFQLNAIIIAF